MAMAKIKTIIARQILDSRGNPTVEADVLLEDGILGRAAVPSGASTGIHEALELRDGDKKVYQGKSVLKAVEHVKNEIADAVIGMEVTDQKAIDEKMIALDRTENKTRLGANAILAVSLAAAKAAAISLQQPLYQYFGQLAGTQHFTLPLPQINIFNGGKHANWATDLQEFIIFPAGAESFHDALRMAADVFHSLASVLKTKGYNSTVGDEGGYAPQVQKGNTEPFDLITEAVTHAGYKVGEDIVFGIDAAASEFYHDGKYQLKKENKAFSTEEMIDWLVNLVTHYPIVSLEDCLDQEDWHGWEMLIERLGNKVQIIGDDIFVTNKTFLSKGIAEKTANAILIKLNQIGTLTETIDCVAMAKKAGWHTVISHRSGETEDTTIADLAVGLATGQIKTGSLSRTDRVAKYNQLLRIEEQLGDKAVFAGRKALLD